MNLEGIFKDLVSLPALTLEQIERYHGMQSNQMLSALRAAERHGLVSLSYQLVRGREVTEPIVILRLGEAQAGRAGIIAYEAEKRWHDSFSPKLIVQATAKLCTLCGGHVTNVAHASLSHDISLAEVLLKKRAADPSFNWELVSPHPGDGALPDAVSASGQLAIELVGQYAGKLVAAKLALAAETAIELW